jgi:hypothetical protein
MLKPADAKAMRAYPVSPRVNTPDNDDPELLREMAIAKSQVKQSEPGLFE